MVYDTVCDGMMWYDLTCGYIVVYGVMVCYIMVWYSIPWYGMLCHVM